jgi:hypothetical protein
MSNSKKEQFIKLIKDTFKQCQVTRPYLDREVQGSLIYSLERAEESNIEAMKYNVRSIYEDPSAYDTDGCSELMMGAINSFDQQVEL